MNSIKINKVIYKLLHNNNVLKDMVKDSIYPLIANENTTFPFIVFSRKSINTTYTKDIAVEDKITVDVVCVSDNYTESINIANEVRKTLENIRYQDTEFYITESRVISIEEYTQDNSFVQTLSFQITNAK